MVYSTVYFLPQDLAIVTNTGQKSNKSELQEDVGNRYGEKAVSAAHARGKCM